MKICLECGEGGHLQEMLSIQEAFENHDIFFITSKSQYTKELKKQAKVYYIEQQFMVSLLFLRPKKLSYAVFVLLYLIQGTFASIGILLRERPDVIVTTAGAITIPLCYIGKLLGIHIIYLESLARVHNPSRSGKIVYLVADLFLVQWEALLKQYGKKARYWGSVI